MSSLLFLPNAVCLVVVTNHLRLVCGMCEAGGGVPNNKRAIARPVECSCFDSLPEDTQLLIAKLVLRGQGLPKERLALRLVNRQFADRSHDAYLSLVRCHRGFQLCAGVAPNTRTAFVVQLTQLVIDTCRAPEVMASRVYPFPTQLYARVCSTVYRSSTKHEAANQRYCALHDHSAPMVERAFADDPASVEWCVHYLNGMFCHLNMRGERETRYSSNREQRSVSRFLEVAMGKEVEAGEESGEDALVFESDSE